MNYFTAYFSVEMMGLIGAGNNPMVGMTARVAVAARESASSSASIMWRD